MSHIINFIIFIFFSNILPITLAIFTLGNIANINNTLFKNMTKNEIIIANLQVDSISIFIAFYFIYFINKNICFSILKEKIIRKIKNF